MPSTKMTILALMGMKMLERKFHHCEDLEEYHAGMWKITTGAKRIHYRDAAADLMRCPDEFKEAMLCAINTWPNSCAHNLTCEAANKIAWLGHAGCCISTGSPEDCTRRAWHELTQKEQDEANRVAKEVLDIWVERNTKCGPLFSWGEDQCTKSP